MNLLAEWITRNIESFLLAFSLRGEKLVKWRFGAAVFMLAAVTLLCLLASGRLLIGGHYPLAAICLFLTVFLSAGTVRAIRKILAHN